MSLQPNEKPKVNGVHIFLGLVFLGMAAYMIYNCVIILL